MAYKEIVTKAVIGKGKKKYQNSYQLTVEHNPTTILGCWIINHNFQAKEVNNKIISASLIRKLHLDKKDITMHIAQNTKNYLIKEIL